MRWQVNSAHAPMSAHAPTGMQGAGREEAQLLSGMVLQAEGSQKGRSSQTMTVGTSLGVAGHPCMPWNSAA